MLELAPHNRPGLPSAMARARVLYQEDVGPALLHHGTGVLSKSLNVSEPQFPDL